MQNKICVNVFCYDNKLTYPVYLSDQKFNDNMDLLLISNEFQSHYIYIKDFDRFMFNNTKNRNKKHFCKCFLQCFSSKEILIKHKKDCLVMNGKQSIKLKSSSIRFKNCSKQIPVPFKIYADFECILKKVDCDIIECNSIERNSNISYTKNIKIIFLAVFLIKLIVLTINSVKKFSCTEERMLLINLLNQFLVSTIIAGEW